MKLFTQYIEFFSEEGGEGPGKRGREGRGEGGGTHFFVATMRSA